MVLPPECYQKLVADRIDATSESPNRLPPCRICRTHGLGASQKEVGVAGCVSLSSKSLRAALLIGDPSGCQLNDVRVCWELA